MNKYIILLFLLSVCLIQACCKGGVGGDATIIIHPKHHNAPISGGIAYIKFESQESPGAGTKEYDKQFSATTGSTEIKCTGLKCGKYYVYCTGYDPSIQQDVVGGIPISIKYSERKGELTIDVPVTED